MAVAVALALPPPIGDRIRAGEDAADEPLLIKPFWLITLPPPLIPLAVKITVPLLILPIGGRKRFSLTLAVTLLLLLLGIKLMVLLLTLVVCTLLLLAEPFCCWGLLVVGIIETSLLNL